MKSLQQIDNLAETLDKEVKHSVYDGSKAKTEKQFGILRDQYDDPDKLRKVAGQIKQHTLEHLDQYLEQAESKLKANGTHVHFAVDGDTANQIILDIMNQYGAKKMVKSKSMVSEETELVPFLEKNGKEALETDLRVIMRCAFEHTVSVRPINPNQRVDGFGAVPASAVIGADKLWIALDFIEAMVDRYAVVGVEDPPDAPYLVDLRQRDDVALEAGQSCGNLMLA